MTTDAERCELLCLDLPKAEALRSTRLPADQLEELAQAAKGLGDPTRLAIAIALRDGEEACVCDLGWVLGRDEKLVSHHLRQLKTSGLTRSRRDGKMVMYQLTSRGRALLDTLTAAPASTT
jgi:ArsR family transcriptional regulator, lead/cadmium/zinc/bismuth-responsive transcriptional repressor